MTKTWFLIWWRQFLQTVDGFLHSFCSPLGSIESNHNKFPAPRLRTDAADEIRSPPCELYDPPLQHHHIFAFDEYSLLVLPGGGSCTELGQSLSAYRLHNLIFLWKNIVPASWLACAWSLGPFCESKKISSLFLEPHPHLIRCCLSFGSTTSCSTTILCESGRSPKRPSS